MSTSTSTQLLISDSFAVFTQADFEEGKKKRGGGGGGLKPVKLTSFFYVNNPTKAAFQQMEYVTCMQSLCKNANMKMEIKKLHTSKYV